MTEPRDQDVRLAGMDLARGPEDRLSLFTHELVVGLITQQLHGRGSRAMQETCQHLAIELSAMFAGGIPDPFVLEIGEGCLSFAGEPLVSPSLQAGQLLRLCQERKIRGLGFSSQAYAETLGRFLELLAAPEHVAAFRSGQLEALLAQHPIHGLEFLQLGRDSSPQQAQDPAMAQYQSMAECLQHSHVAAYRGEELQIDTACSIVEAALQQLDNPHGLLALATRDYVDSFTVGHSVRVALLAMQVANHGKIERHELIRVGTAALLHDIGKSRVPQEILLKQGPLDDAEWELMREHPRLGGEILLEQKQLDPCCIGAAFCHHMAGKGAYPDPKIAFEPSGISKLVRVCDVFEALTSVRPYKRALSPLEAYAVMLRKPEDFDQDWLRFFISAMGVFPLGSYLELSSGEAGLVVGHGPNPAQPKMQVIGEAGLLEEDGKPLEVVLGQPHHGVTRDLGAPVWEQSFHTANLHCPEEHDPEAAASAPRSCCGEDLGADTGPGED